MDPLAALALQGSPWAIVSLAVISLIRGWLIPRSTHREIVGQLERTIAKLEAAEVERAKQVSILLGRRDPGS